MERVYEALQRALSQGGALQPNSAPCFVCGLANAFGLHLRFVQVTPDRVVAYTQIPRRFQGYPGVVHGGITAAILDETAGRSLMGAEPEEARLMFTARLNVRYRRPVPVETPLRAEGWVVKDRGRTAVTQAALYLEGGTQPLAEAEALLVALPPEMESQMDAQALGWRIYPLEPETVTPPSDPCAFEFSNREG